MSSNKIITIKLKNYILFLKDIKNKITKARIRAYKSLLNLQQLVGDIHRV